METETRVLPPTEEALELAAALLCQGELVAFPTETVYGRGANALDPQAVLRIFAAKGRPADNPLIVHIWDKAQLADLCEVSADAEKLMDACWPGPLTILCPKKALVPDEVTAGLPSVGIRMPSHPAARAMLRRCGLPVAAPSANLSTRPSPTTAAHVLEDMNGRIPLILDGGPCEVGLESTVLDMTGDVPVVLRPGAVTPEMIRDIVGSVRVADSVMRPLREGETAPSPGMKHKHSAPRGHLTILKGRREDVIREIIRRYDESENAVILASTGNVSAYGGRRVMDMGPDLSSAAHNLFSLLRRADGLGIARLYAEAVSDGGVGLAVMNRMARAAGFDIEEAGTEDRPSCPPQTE